MALALPTAHALAEVMPQSSSTKPDLDFRLVVSTEPRYHANYSDASSVHNDLSALSQEESDNDIPMSPIVFKRNEEYERSRLSYFGPVPPRPSTTPSTPTTPTSPQSLSPLSPVIFSQPNLSSPSIHLQPPPVFPSAGTQSLALRLKRPLPPLPKVDTNNDSSPSEARRQEHVAVSATSSGTRPSPSSSSGRDTDSVGFSSPSSSAAQSPATSVYTSAFSDSTGSLKAVEAFPASVDTKPRIPPLTIPVRSQSNPLPQNPQSQGQSGMALIGRHIVNSPYISVTPASPTSHQQFPSIGEVVRQNKRSASATSIVLPSPHSGGAPAFPHEPSSHASDRYREPSYELVNIPRSSSPAPSLAPSMASTKSSFGQAGKFSLKRIASKTRLFGRRTLSASSETMWDSDEYEDTIVGHSSSLDDRMLRPNERARSESPTTTISDGSAVGKGSMDIDGSICPSAILVPRSLSRLEILEAVWTPEGDVWELRDVSEVIPKLRRLKAARS